MRSDAPTRPGYQRAAAGIVGCLLVGNAFSLGVQQQAPPISVEAQPVPAPPPAQPSGGEEADYLALRRQMRRHASQPLPRILTYTVKPGDSLWGIADELGTDVDVLLDLNKGIQPARLRPGQTLHVVSGFHGEAYTVRTGDTLARVAAAHGLTVQRLESANQMRDSSGLQTGDVLLLPVDRPRPAGMVASRSGGSRSAESRTAEIRSAETRRRSLQATEGQAGEGQGAEGQAAESPTASLSAEETAALVAKASGPWVWPVDGGTITSEFGKRWGALHRGIDIAAKNGTPAVAVQKGTVLFAGWDGSYGYCVVVDHGGGVKTRYAHASALLVSAGDAVEQGTPVLEVGSTGRSTGPHLHFEVVVDDAQLNPRLFLP